MTRLGYTESGDSHQPAILFLHGFMGSGADWAETISALDERYYCVAPDLPGQGCSLGLPPEDYTIEGATRTLLDLLDGLEISRAALVGYSMGGRLALHAALRRPRLLGGLVIVGASAGIEDAAAREERRSADERLAGWMEGHSIEEIVAAWEGLPVFAGQSRELRESLRPGRLSHVPQELASLLRTAGQGTLPPVWDRLGEITSPTLLVAGEADDAYVRSAYRMSEALPRGRARLVPGSGHAPQLEQPDAFARVLVEFLEEALPAGRT